MFFPMSDLIALSLISCSLLAFDIWLVLKVAWLVLIVASLVLIVTWLVLIVAWLFSYRGLTCSYRGLAYSLNFQRSEIGINMEALFLKAIANLASSPAVYSWWYQRRLSNLIPCVRDIGSSWWRWHISSVWAGVLHTGRLRKEVWWLMIYPTLSYVPATRYTVNLIAFHDQFWSNYTRYNLLEMKR